jgi:hypothetical protein
MQATKRPVGRPRFSRTAEGTRLVKVSISIKISELAVIDKRADQLGATRSSYLVAMGLMGDIEDARIRVALSQIKAIVAAAEASEVQR